MLIQHYFVIRLLSRRKAFFNFPHVCAPSHRREKSSSRALVRALDPTVSIIASQPSAASLKTVTTLRTRNPAIQRTIKGRNALHSWQTDYDHLAPPS